MMKWAAFVLALWAPLSLHAQALIRLGEDRYNRPIEAGVDVAGEMRLRADLLHNFDLDRGLTPSGAPLYPVPLSDPTAQNLSRADLRLRVDLDGHSAGGTVGVKLRVDVLDNMPLGGNADFDGVVVSQRPPRERAFVIQRAYGYAATPIGMLAAGRMNNSWGLGILANAGDCRSCTVVSTADRIAFATPLVGHVWALSYDFTSTGPFMPSRDGASFIGLDPGTNASAVVAAVAKTHSDLALERRRRAERFSAEYGAYYAHGWQPDDIGASRLPTLQGVTPSAALVQERGLKVNSFSVWGRLTTRQLRVELEGVLVRGEIAQPSLVPGLVIQRPLAINTWGAALETELGALEDRHRLGLDLGLASGDDAPGFGAFPKPGAPPPRPGDLDGTQADLVRDYSVDNFRFHPNYQIDRILFREIIGSVTDAAYVRLRGSYDLVRTTNFRIVAALDAVGSVALHDASTPGGAAPLGIELDPTLSYLHSDMFELALEQATLIPLSGLDNTVAGLAARPAQLWRIRAHFAF